MLLSDELSISHEAIISHSAISCESNKDFFSGIVFGVSHSKTADITRQNRF